MKLLKRPLFWVGLVALLLVASVAARLLTKGRDQTSASASVTANGPVLELSSNDLATVGVADLKQIIQANGSLRPVNQASVKAKVAGEVKEVLVREGDSVKAGQLIARIDPIEYDWKTKQARENMMAAQGQLDIAKRTLDNNKALLTQGFISATALENSQGQFNTAQANVAANQAALALAQKSLNDTLVRAPMNGIVSGRSVEPGEKVSVDGKLFDIVDLSALELEGSVPAADIGQVQIGQDVAITPEGFDTPLAGRITRISPANQSGSRSYLVYAQLLPTEPAMASRLRAGLFANAAITVAQKNQVLVVPGTALRSNDQQSTVYAIEGDRLLSRAIQTGFRGSDNQLEIIGGLTAGTRIVRVNLGQLNEGPVKVNSKAAIVPVTTATKAGA